MLQKDETISNIDSPHKLWTKEGNTFKAHKVDIGTTNGMLTEILSGIAEGTEVLTDFEIISNKPQGPATEGTSNPFMPRPRNNRNNANPQQKR